MDIPLLGMGIALQAQVLHPPAHADSRFTAPRHALSIRQGNFPWSANDPVASGAAFAQQGDRLHLPLGSEDHAAEVPGALRHDTNESLPVVVLGRVELDVATNPGQHQGQNRHPAEPLLT